MLTEILAIFKELGLREEEIKFYLASLELGKTTIAEVSKKISVPRSTSYLLLESLKNKGLIIESPVGRKRTIVALNPHELVRVFEEKGEKLAQAKSGFTKLLPELLSITNSLSNKPRVRFYEGKEGIKTIYEETLAYPEIWVHCTTQEAMEYMSGYLENYCQRVIKKGIKTKEIVSDSPDDLEYQQEYSTPKNIIKTIPLKYATNTDFMIYGDKVAFLSYRGGEPVGIVIEDHEIAQLERKKFEILWKAIKEKIL
jgi:sugar-specific transcriptional regulator TrmB